MATITHDSSAASSKRKQRPDPDRILPNRQMTSVLRAKARGRSAAPQRPPSSDEPSNAPAPASAPPASAANTPPHEPARRPETSEGRAIRTGYELAEAAIRRGKEAAKRLAPDGSSLNMKDLPGAKEALGLAEGALRAWAELATVWIRAVLPLGPEMLTDPTRLLAPLREAMSGQASSGRAAKSGQALSSAPFVVSARPARVALELSREVDPAALAVQPLQPVGKDPAKRPSLVVDLHPSKDGGSIEVHVQAPAAQPSGRYMGAVYDKTSGAFVGGLTVDLG